MNAFARSVNDVATPFAPYRRVLTLPGAWVFSVSGLAARLPMAMVSLGIVLLVSTRTGSYGTASAVAASFLVANASTGILLARLIDRLGQSRVLPVRPPCSAVGLVGMMAAVEAGRPAPWPQLFAAVAGTGLPPIGSSIRARWSYVVSDKDDLHTAFAFESVVDEVVFIVGPALVTTLAAIVHPLAGLVSAVTATVVGTSVLVTQKQTEPPATRAQRGDRAGGDAVARPGAVDRVRRGHGRPARRRRGGHRGPRGEAGVGLAVRADAGALGRGSLVSGIITGAMHPKAGNVTRFRCGVARPSACRCCRCLSWTGSSRSRCSSSCPASRSRPR